MLIEIFFREVNVILLMKNCFGKFVIRKALYAAPEELRNNMIKHIINLSCMIDDPNFFEKWKKML